jgi:uncharacterized Zn finger protein (UPF0148 family)
LKRGNWYPYRDKQQDWPQGSCRRCGGEQYPGETGWTKGICPDCQKEEIRHSTLAEMSVEYRAQAEKIKARIRALRQERRETQDPDQAQRLLRRIEELEALFRETRDQAVLLEHYYDRGYRRNARYTL